MAVKSNWNRDPYDASANGPAFLRSKHYQPRPATQHFRQSQRSSPAREIDKPLGVLPAPSDCHRQAVRRAAEEVIGHGAALGGNARADGERWVHEYLDAHHLLQADFLCEVYDAAIRSAVAECLKSGAEER